VAPYYFPDSIRAGDLSTDEDVFDASDELAEGEYDWDYDYDEVILP
jgi:hypothetical protein